MLILLVEAGAAERLGRPGRRATGRRSPPASDGCLTRCRSPRSRPHRRRRVAARVEEHHQPRAGGAALADGTSPLDRRPACRRHRGDGRGGSAPSGAEVGRLGTDAQVGGTAGRPVSDVAPLDARLSGTTARFLLPVAGLGKGTLPRRRRAPHARAADAARCSRAVRQLGAEVHRAGRRTSRSRSSAASGGTVRVPGDVSSQFLSGLLLAGPAMPTGLTGRARRRRSSRSPTST